MLLLLLLLSANARLALPTSAAKAQAVSQRAKARLECPIARNRPPVRTAAVATPGADGLSEWALRNPRQTLSLARGVAYGQGTFVVTHDDSVLISTDGADWSEHLVATNASLVNVAFLNGNFIALGNGLYISSDGISWSETAPISGTAVTYGRGLYVVAGSTIHTSPDLTTWTESDLGHDYLDVAYGLGTFVAVGYRLGNSSAGEVSLAEVAWSRDGRRWNHVYGNSPAGPRPLGGVTYANGTFIGVGGMPAQQSTPSYETIVTSPDGLEWTTQVDEPGPLLTGVTYGNGLFVAVGDRILSSANGFAWTASADAPAPVSGRHNGITYGHRTFLTAGQLSGICQSGVLSPDDNPPRFGPIIDSLTSNGARLVELQADVDRIVHIESSIGMTNWASQSVFINSTPVVEVPLPKVELPARLYRASYVAEYPGAKTIRVNTTDALLAAFQDASNGDTILIEPGTYEVTPLEPLGEDMPYAGGAPLLLDGKSDINVFGVGNPVIQATCHGSIFTRKDCVRCHLRGVTFRGQGYITQPLLYYFSLVLYVRSPYCDTTDCVVEDSGDQAIAELHYDGPEGSDYCTIARNVISRCGDLAHPILRGDGAGVAWGNCYGLIEANVITDCMRGVEIETNNPLHPTIGNRILGNEIRNSLWQAVICIPEHNDADLFLDNEIAYNLIQGRGAPNPLYPQWGTFEGGIVINGGRRYSVHDNTIGRLNNWWGVDADTSKAELTDCAFTQNSIHDCGRGGIWCVRTLSFNGRHVIRGNEIGAQPAPGVWLVGDQCLVEQNVVQPPTGTDSAGNPWPPVYCDGTDDVVLQDFSGAGQAAPPPRVSLR
jgi:hypothetical protein